MLSTKDLEAALDEIRASGLNDITPVEAQLLAARMIADALHYVGDQLETVRQV